MDSGLYRFKSNVQKAHKRLSIIQQCKIMLSVCFIVGIQIKKPNGKPHSKRHRTEVKTDILHLSFCILHLSIYYLTVCII